MIARYILVADPVINMRGWGGGSINRFNPAIYLCAILSQDKEFQRHISWSFLRLLSSFKVNFVLLILVELMTITVPAFLLTRRVPLLEQDLPTLPERLSSRRCLVKFVLLDL